MSTSDETAPLRAPATAEEFWASARSHPGDINLEALRQFMFLRDGTTPAPAVDSFFDSFSMHQRIDVIDEEGLPFLPFVRPLNKRQFDLLRYGILLSEEHKIFVVHHPMPAVTLSGAQTDNHDGDQEQEEEDPAARAQVPDVSRRAKEEFNVYLIKATTVNVPLDSLGRPVDQPPTEVATAPVGDIPTTRVSFTPQFRIVFRNQGGDDRANASYLVAGVYVNGNDFTNLHDDLRRPECNGGIDYFSDYAKQNLSNTPALAQRQQAWLLWDLYTGTSVLSRPDLAKAVKTNIPIPTPRKEYGSEAAKRALPPAPNTCGFEVEDYEPDATVDRPKQVNDSDVPPSEQGHDAIAVIAGAIPAPQIRRKTEDFIPRECTYSQDRMLQRVVVVERQHPRAQWQAFNDELGLNDWTETGAPIDAATIILRDTRNGVNRVEDGEICAFLPSDSECHLQTVHRTHAEEQLRLWLTQALITAENNGIHQVCLRLDVPFLLSRCIGLLSVGGGMQRTATVATGTIESDAEAETATVRENGRVLAIRIAVEAIEDFIRHSGIVWRAIIIADGPPNGDENALSDYAIATGIFRNLQQEKLAIETALSASPMNREPSPRKSRVRDEIARQSAAESPGRRHVNKIIVAEPYRIRAPKATTCGLFMDQDELSDLYHKLDKSNDGYLSVSELKAIFKRQTHRYEAPTLTERGTIAPKMCQESYWSSGSMLTPLDACGLPATDAEIERMILKHCRTQKDKMTFQEFCTLMLELARR